MKAVKHREPLCLPKIETYYPSEDIANATYTYLHIHVSSAEIADKLDEDPLLRTSSLRWRRGRRLGEGTFGTVWEGLLHSGHMIAVKQVEHYGVKLPVRTLRVSSHPW